MKKIIATLLVLFTLTDAYAVLKEKDLEQTLSVLRTELTEKHTELHSQSNERKEAAKSIVDQLKETIKKSNQNALMLYSQREKISSYADKCINEILTCNNNNVKANFINGISGVSFALSILLRLSPTQLKRT